MFGKCPFLAGGDGRCGKTGKMCVDRLAELWPCKLAWCLGVAPVLLPLAVYFILCAYSSASETIPPMLPYQDTVEHLAGQSVAYWFLALAAISIASWTWILKWILRQLEQQRLVNLDVTGQLIAYMEKDHADMRAIIARVAAALERAEKNPAK